MSYLALDISKPAFLFFIGEFSFDGQWEHPVNQHQADFELILAEKGTLSILVNDRPFILKPGDVILVPPYAKVTGNGKMTQQINFYWLHFYCDYKVVDSIDDESKDQLIFSSKFHVRDINDILILLSELMNMEMDRKTNELPLNLLTTTILARLNIECSRRAKNTHLSALVSQSIEWIRANISTDLSIKDVAQHFEVSNAYLAQQFKHDLNITPLQHLLGLKIQAAKVLLVKTNLPIYEISENSYFRNEKNFIRVFKKHTGITPSNYRRHFAYHHQNNPFVDPSIPIPREMQEKYHIQYK